MRYPLSTVQQGNISVNYVDMFCILSGTLSFNISCNRICNLAFCVVNSEVNAHVVYWGM